MCARNIPVRFAVSAFRRVGDAKIENNRGRRCRRRHLRAYYARLIFGSGEHGRRQAADIYMKNHGDQRASNKDVINAFKMTALLLSWMHSCKSQPGFRSARHNNILSCTPVLCSRCAFCVWKHSYGKREDEYDCDN